VLSVGLTVSSVNVNVNGIRAAAQKGLARWLASTTAHVVCLSGRYPEVDPPGVTIASLYLPNGTVGAPTEADIRSAVVERAATHGERWSDHAPITVTYGPA
jgi:exonuclease III